MPARRIAVIILPNGPGAIVTATETAALERLAPPAAPRAAVAPRTVASDGSLLVGPPGAPVRGFLPVRGTATGRWYLHDGLSAFARVD